MHNALTMSSFPTELVVNIVLRLPPEDLIRCMCVSKAWNAFIGDQSFFKSHRQRSIQTISIQSVECIAFDLPLGDNEMLGSPVKIVHPLKDARTLISSSSVNGLFCIRNKDYGDFSLRKPSIQRLLWILMFKRVISLKSNSWKSIENMPGMTFDYI